MKVNNDEMIMDQNFPADTNVVGYHYKDVFYINSC